MLMSDIIAHKILEMLNSSSDGMAEISRNTLADSIGCVPSQINYVISSRFTPEHGYVVESKRGGGGYIRITQIRDSSSTTVMHIVNSIGDTIDRRTAVIIIENLLERRLIDVSEAKLMAASMSDNCYRNIKPDERGQVRAAVLKQMLMTLV
ncbi:MAG: CtsR family transcriptional regulator [Firmicutes bacterium]|nr:CtsR family transcriptional regulator [Bacillota bacterium]